MKLLLLSLPLTYALNIVSSNDDGWAESNVRALHSALTDAGHTVVLSAPAENKSGSGSKDEDPVALTDPCQYNSCPAGSPATGYNESSPELNYVNSYPVTSMKYGIDTLAPKFFDGAPDLAVSGPNVGVNIGIAVFFSGTVGAATAAVKAGVPALAFSGRSGSATAWNETTPESSTFYADLATNFTERVTANGAPYLPDGAWLNVNFPSFDDGCDSVDDVKFVLTRIFPAVPLITDDDVETCGSKRLPTETKTVLSGCYASVSVGQADDKKDANATVQAEVLERLGELECLD
ncbi:acid phosphatase precursor [Aspergillus steynii IBT 23096]|uniref:Acid phosphatase n=1 Tax=Aspergillus steynii IBT 23096 TaxID=1392250 RepID=A0A2I2GAC6_9EURO|nr:acid phosphatase precursor [Aspergillus steynii IBT 23096]PLB49830.1 acid phosphatase precursor [Aspergillus steynii IBT 23096]